MRRRRQAGAGRARRAKRIVPCGGGLRSGGAFPAGGERTQGAGSTGRGGGYLWWRRARRARIYEKEEGASNWEVARLFIRDFWEK